MNRRSFIQQTVATGAIAAGLAPSLLAQNQPANAAPLRIVGIACSHRKGKTTATALQAALEAAAQADPRIKIELIDLGAMNLTGLKEPMPAGDDFDKLILPQLKDPAPAGLIIGSPTFFRGPSSLCMALLERLSVLRKPTPQLAGIAAGAIAVGAMRNGGQDQVVQTIHAAMLWHGATIDGGKPNPHPGAILWNAAENGDDITKDTYGLESARKLGQRIAEAALKRL